MIDPGMLNTRLQLQAPVETADGQGGVVREYTTTATVWAQVTPFGGRSDIEAGADGATLRYRIVLRSHHALNLRHRFIDGDRVYRIITIRDRHGGGFREIDAELRID